MLNSRDWQIANYYPNARKNAQITSHIVRFTLHATLLKCFRQYFFNCFSWVACRITTSSLFLFRITKFKPNTRFCCIYFCASQYGVIGFAYIPSSSIRCKTFIDNVRVVFFQLILHPYSTTWYIIARRLSVSRCATSFAAFRRTNADMTSDITIVRTPFSFSY